MEQKPKKSNILRFFPYTKGFRLQFVLSLFMVMVAVVANYMTPQVIRVTVDSVINDSPFNLPGFLVGWIESIGGRDMLRSHIVICAGASLAFAALSGLANYSSRMNLARACEGTVARVRDTLFDHIQHLPYAWHNSHQTGDIIQRCTQDVDLIRNFVSDQLMEVVRTVLLIGVSLALMFAMNVELALVVTAFIPLVVIVSLVFYVIVGRKFQRADETEGELTALVQENLTGVRVVRAFGRERYEIDRFNKKNEEFTNMWVNLGKIMGINWGLGDFSAGFQVLVIIVVGVFFVEAGNLTAGEFLAFTAYNSMLVWPARNLGRLLSELSKTSISATRLFDILDAKEEQDAPRRQDPAPSPATSFFRPRELRLQPLLRCGGGRELYHQSREHLRHFRRHRQRQVHFNVPAGPALRAAPGARAPSPSAGWTSGTSSWPTCGKTSASCCRSPSSSPRPFRESIADGSTREDLESVRHYARLAVIDDAIVNFAQGYETPIGERGVTISGGQKQRVAIARMLMQDTPIKIFDDSLSAVDMETDQKIRQSIQQNVHGTTILIAHRITTLMNADQILVLDHGRVAQLGNHQQLSQQEGIYKRIFDMQKGTGEEN